MVDVSVLRQGEVYKSRTQRGNIFIFRYAYTDACDWIKGSASVCIKGPSMGTVMSQMYNVPISSHFSIEKASREEEQWLIECCEAGKLVGKPEIEENENYSIY